MQQNQALSFPWELLLDWYEMHGRHHLPWRDYAHPEL
jgi:adenine-specific DNA glycosylase